MLTQDRVKELFDYRDGALVRKKSVSSLARIGNVAGSPDAKGYLTTCVDGKSYKNHRLVWMWHHGYFPEYGLDHINRDRKCNRIENLREVSHVCNMRNTNQQRNNTSGVRGVNWDKKLCVWTASLKINGRKIHLGCTPCFLEAVCLRLAAEQCVDWSGCNSTSPAFLYVQAKICK